MKQNKWGEKRRLDLEDDVLVVGPHPRERFRILVVVELRANLIPFDHVRLFHVPDVGHAAPASKPIKMEEILP